jgi:quinol monooxygenase YgiN
MRILALGCILLFAIGCTIAPQSNSEAVAADTSTPAWTPTTEGKSMYGLIGQMTAVPGQRDALIAILLEGVAGMPGCLSYVVAKDPEDENAIWITEVWDSPASHQASLSLPSVKHAIARGKPLIAGFGKSIVTEPLGGHGLALAPGR